MGVNIPPRSEQEELAHNLKGAFEKREMRTFETPNFSLRYYETVVNWDEVAESILRRERRI
jgi:hypothetical protein